MARRRSGLHAGFPHEWERDAKRVPGRCSGSTAIVPPWRSTMSRAIASPSPVPPSSAVRASSSRVKRSNTRSSLVRPGCPAVVGHREHGRAGRASASVNEHGRARGGRRCRRGCAPPGAAGRRRRRPARRRHAADVDRRPARRSRSRRGLAQHDVVEVDRLAAPSGAAPASLRGQVEQVVDEALQPDDLLEHAAVGRRAGRPARDGRGRPRARSGSGSAGCAARGRRRRRSAAGGGSRPRRGRAWRSSCGPAGRSRRRLCGSGTRRWRSVPPMSATSARIASTGRSVRPTSHQIERGQEHDHDRDRHDERRRQRRVLSSMSSRLPATWMTSRPSGACDPSGERPGTGRRRRGRRRSCGSVARLVSSGASAMGRSPADVRAAGATTSPRQVDDLGDVSSSPQPASLGPGGSCAVRSRRPRRRRRAAAGVVEVLGEQAALRR